MFPAPIYFIIFLGILSYIFGKNRSKKKITFNKNTGGQPSHYGYYCLIWVTVPSVIFFLLWQFSILPKDVTLQKLLLENIIIVAKGGKSLAEVPSESVDYFRKLKFISTVASYSSTLIISLIFCFLSFRKIDPSLMAKNAIERFILSVLFISSVVAILTTIGIIMSLIFETTKFFNKFNFFDNLFG